MPPARSVAQTIPWAGASLFQLLYAPSSAPDSVILRSTGGSAGTGGSGGTGGTGGTGGSGQLPAVVAVTQSHTTWREGTKLAVFSRATAPVGDTFAFSLNEPARVTLYFDRTVQGRKLFGKCVAATSQSRRKPACKRTLTAGAIRFSAHAGLNRVVFQGQLSKSRTLALGRYTLRIVAAAGGKSSKARTLSFTIVK